MCKEYCKDPKYILKVEKAIIADHIDKHKWCNRIKSDGEAIVDFVHKFAWLMREVYCGAMCPHREKCKVNGEFQKIFSEQPNEKDLQEYIKFAYGEEEKDLIHLKIQVLKRDISTHKWLNKIENYEDAVKDFLQKFGWLIFEMYRRTKKEDNHGNRCN